MEVQKQMRQRLYSLALVALLGCGFALAQSMPQRQNPTGMQPQAQTSDQTALKAQSDIQTALAKDASSASSNVNVQATSSGVELTGTVASQDDKNKVEQIATAHSGGLPVRDNIKVVASSPK
jgi:osmotically-inducible protein OsmY